MKEKKKSGCAQCIDPQLKGLHTCEKRERAPKSKCGAMVRYCGHDAMFVADVFEIAGACVVVASAAIDKCLIRPATDEATHHLIDWPKAGYWNPRAGIFVVPSDQVTIL
jgi:hypothetical protein